MDLLPQKYAQGYAAIWRQASPELRGILLMCLSTLCFSIMHVIIRYSSLSTDLHVCRTVCRRAERMLCLLAETEEVDADALKYVNRLSDAFFVWSRWAVLLAGDDEELWAPNAASEAIDG